MPKQVQPVPEGYRTVTPSLTIKGAAKAIEFYKKAFGAVERMPPALSPKDGRVMHAEILIGDSLVMLNDEFPEMKNFAAAARFYVYVQDCDAWAARAQKAGAKLEYPLTDMFYGDRCGCLSDPWGNRWTVATHKEDLTPEQIKERMNKTFATAAK